MYYRVGQVIRRAALATFVGSVSFLGVLYGVGSYETQRFSQQRNYLPDGQTGPERARIHDLHIGLFREWRRVAFRLDVGLDVFASWGWIIVVGSTLLLAVAWYAVQRSSSAQLDAIQSPYETFFDKIAQVNSKIPDAFVGMMRGYTTFLAISWFLVLAIFTVALILGPAPQADTPAVSTDDPPAELGADALADAQTRRHTVEWWFSVGNQSDGARLNSIIYEADIDPDPLRFRAELWAIGFDQNTRPSAPSVHYYGTRQAEWGEWQEGHWRRSDDDYTPYFHIFWDDHPVSDSVFRGTNATVVARNDSTITIEYTDREVHEAFEIGILNAENATGRVLVTIATTPEPHLQRIVAEATRDQEFVRSTYRFSDVGTARVDAPDRVPATFERIVWRTTFGLRRMGSWVGL